MNYWVFRQETDREKLGKLLFRELKKGRLRQGWGWSPDFDVRDEDEFLQRYQAEAECDETTAQKVFNKLKGMLRVREGDILVIPKQPNRESFTVVRAASGEGTNGVYSFGDAPPEHNDFRHIIPVDPSSLRTFNYYSASVPDILTSRLKGKAYSSPIKIVLKTQLQKAIDECYGRPASPKDRKPQDFKEKVHQFREQTYMSWLSFARSLTNTEFERLVCEILEAQGYYIVRHHMYDREGGDVDIVCTRKSEFGVSCILGASELEVTYHVQAKKKTGPDLEDTVGVQQLLKIDGDVATFKTLITTADDFTDECRELADKHSVHLICGRELAQIALGQAGDLDDIE